MTRERWLNTVSDVEEKFEVLEKVVHSNDDLSVFQNFEQKNEEGLMVIENPAELPRLVDYVVFLGPEGKKMKFEYIVSPRFLKEKTLFTKRLGSTVKVEKLYDPRDPARTFTVYREEGGEWVEVRA